MNDLFHNLMKWCDHNRYTTVGVAALVGLVVVSTSCQAITRSPFDPSVEVGRAQLDADVTAYAARVKSAYRDLEYKEAAIERALSVMTGLAQQYGGPLGPFVTSALGVGGLIAGGGAMADNRRKDRLIRVGKGTLKAVSD